jgi:hypothetical protein
LVRGEEEREGNTNIIVDSGLLDSNASWTSGLLSTKPKLTSSLLQKPQSHINNDRFLNGVNCRSPSSGILHGVVW